MSCSKLRCNFVSILLLSIIWMLSSVAKADTAQADTTQPTPPNVAATTPDNAVSPTKEFLGFDYSGYIDGSYNYLFRSNSFISGNFDRVFDLDQNGFTLQQAAITIAKQPANGFGLLVNPIIGRDAYGVSSYGTNPNASVDSQNLGTTWLQAYLQYAHGPFTFLVGKFLSLVGEEQTNPTQDSNFSRSILFYATPLTNTGIRGVYVINDKVTLSAGINDGWDNITDWSRHKTIELAAAFTINPMFSFSVAGYSGQQRITNNVSSGPVGQRSIFDLVATLTATSKLNFATEYDYVWQTQALLPSGDISRAVWQGIAGYVNYKWNDLWQSSLRGEIFEDSNGFVTGVRQNWREITLSLGYTPLNNMEIRAETRHDFFNVNSVFNTQRTAASNYQQSVALEAFYRF